MADKPDSNPASFHYSVTSRRPSAYAEASAGQAWATRKGGARSEPERRRYAGAGQPIYIRRRAIGWLSSQSVRSTRFRRISFFEPESYTFLLKIVQHYLHWATRKGEARSEPECRRHPATYTQPQEGDWLVFQPISA